MKFVIIGLSVTSSWGNGHATTYRALLKELSRAGHEILFLEKDVPYYAANRDMPSPDFCSLGLYRTNEDLFDRYKKEVAAADVVIVGSYVQQGVAVGNWVVKTAQGIKAFYDIDTPVTFAKLERKEYEYISPSLIKEYDLYLSFSGVRILGKIEKYYGSPAARALYCSVDPENYYPDEHEKVWQMGYLGTYSTDRQPGVALLLSKPALASPDKSFVVAGPQYPQDINWPENVERIEHLPPEKHRAFYNSQKFTLNITRQDMIKAGFSPSVRLFEVVCGVPIISDYWEGLTSLFEEGKEILIARSSDDVMTYFSMNDEERMAIGQRCREAVLKNHTAKARAAELIRYINDLKGTKNVFSATLVNKLIP